MIVPFPESSLNQEAGKLFMENYDEYFKIAKIFTNVYASKTEEKDNILKDIEENGNIRKNENYLNNDLNIKHSKSENFAQGSFPVNENIFSLSNNKLTRKESCEEYSTALSNQKPNLNNLNLIRKNSGNMYSFIPNNSVNNNVNNMNNFIMQTPKTKKDEMKKWLSRI